MKIIKLLASFCVLPLFLACLAMAVPQSNDGGGEDEGGWIFGNCVDGDNCQKIKCHNFACRRCTSSDKNRRCQGSVGSTERCRTCTNKPAHNCGSPQQQNACTTLAQCSGPGAWTNDTSVNALSCKRTSCWQEGNNKPTECQ